VILCGLVAGGYVAGRLIEVAFHQLGRCGIFAWRPFDAWFRLVTARRNPCLVILTIGTLAGRPELAFVGVVAWTVASTAILFLRLLSRPACAGGRASRSIHGSRTARGRRASMPSPGRFFRSPAGLIANGFTTAHQRGHPHRDTGTRGARRARSSFPIGEAM
jgi:hypothetical protein